MENFRIFYRLIAIVGILAITSCCGPNKIIGSLPVPLYPQETGMWCWAASGKMCMDFLGGSVTQCDEADKRFRRTDCCNSPVPSLCVNGGWPEFEKYNFSASLTNNAALSWDDIKCQIYCKHKPIAFSWHWNGGGGHMMVITGYVVINNTNWVTINDPWPPNEGDQRAITYEEYVSSAEHTHWNDYYNITKK